MSTPLLTIAGILGVGATYVLMPVALDTYRRFRKPRKVICPDVGNETVVGLDAKHAAVTSAIGATQLRVKDCSNWPEHDKCVQDCIEQMRI